MIDFLDGFEKRMEIVGVVESIVNRKKKDMEIESLFGDNDFVSLVFSVLLYIMEKTLSEDSDCDIDHIQGFIGSILPEHYGLEIDKGDLGNLTGYIIKNVLQNEGVSYSFSAVSYSSGNKMDIPIRLIRDRVVEDGGLYRVNYSLTDQGYDFLFRTKEVDQEIKMTIEELKLRELIKRKNFKKAHDQSLQLIQMVRQKKKEISFFVSKIKENIHDVDIGEYEQLVDSTYKLLGEEYSLMGDIMDMALKSENRIREDCQAGMELDDKLRKAQHDIKKIGENIKAALSEQRHLIVNRQSLTKIYKATMSDSFERNIENRYDMEDIILRQMEEHVDMADEFWQLVNPLFMPNVYSNINIRSMYEPQGMIQLESGEESAVIEKEELMEDCERERIEGINETYVEIMEYLLTYVREKREVSFDEVINSLEADKETFEKFTKDRLLFMTILKLYDIGSIDVEEWERRGGKVVMNLSEEFNLEYCLGRLADERECLRGVKRLDVSKLGDELIEVEINRSKEGALKEISKIEMSNFCIKVVKRDEFN
ncbi:MAG: hypothetical protein JJE29_01075 [Peptostreptococcaceae bacterium]|nr:hypothetical protein [Peptostreptococcaceae bacterium]